MVVPGGQILQIKDHAPTRVVGNRQVHHVAHGGVHIVLTQQVKGLVHGGSFVQQQADGGGGSQARFAGILADSVAVLDHVDGHRQALFVHAVQGRIQADERLILVRELG